MPHQSGNPATPTTTATPPEPPALDPEAKAAENTEMLDALIRDLNLVRAEQSKCLAETQKRNSGAVALARSPMSIEELDERVERQKLDDREEGIMTQIREMRGEGVGYF